MIDDKYEALMGRQRALLTGGQNNNTDSLAPLLCNTANTDYGKLIALGADLFIVTHLAFLGGYETSWTDEYDKIRVDCGSEYIHVYLHENYRESKPETIEGIVLEWLKKQELEEEL